LKKTYLYWILGYSLIFFHILLISLYDKTKLRRLTEQLIASLSASAVRKVIIFLFPRNFEAADATHRMRLVDESSSQGTGHAHK